MKIRKSFFIRWLLSVDQLQERSVIEIEHIQSGDRQRVSTLEEASEWMKKIAEESKNVKNSVTN